MRQMTFAAALGFLLILSVPAKADSMGVTGGAYDVQGFAGFSMNGGGLSINAANDFGPGDIGGLREGQSYNLSYTVGSEYFGGRYGNAAITGSGSITWQFTVMVPSIPGGEISLQVPGMVSGSFSFCSPTEYQQSSSCGAQDNPLGSATFAGIGTDTMDLNCTVSGVCSIYADYLEPYIADANVNLVPEPSTLALLLGASLFAYPAHLYLRRRRLAVARSN